MSTASVVLGLNAKLYRNTGTQQSPTWTEIANVKDVTLNLTLIHGVSRRQFSTPLSLVGRLW